MQTQTQTQTKTYKTADLYFAAFLSVAGVPIDGMHKEGKRRVFITFVDEGQVSDLHEGYYRKKAKIPGLAFTQEIKNLKNQIAELLEKESG